MSLRTPMRCLAVALLAYALCSQAQTIRLPLTPTATSAAKPQAGFTRISNEASGVLFTNFLAQHRHLTNNLLLNGSGVACGDIDGDGRVDIYFCGLDSHNALYRNLGNWRFENIAEKAGVACPGLDATGTALVDLDGDRDLDLIVNSFGQGTHVFLNNGKGKFAPATPPTLNGRYGGTSLALGDVDGNGTIDLYIANYRTISIRDQPNTSFNVRVQNGVPYVASINGRPLTDPDLTNRFSFRLGMVNGAPTFGNDENGEPDGLFLNDGKGDFTHVPFTSGAFLDESGKPLSSPPFDWGMSVMMRDINGDGAPDLYVCNDFKSPDRIWINNGRGTFRPIAPDAIRHTPMFSMGVDMADVNRDGHLDIVILDMLSRDHRRRLTQRADLGSLDSIPITVGSERVQSPRNVLLLGRGDGTFAEAAQFAGIHASEWSWTPIFLDVDLDGYEDLLIANGFERDAMNADVAAAIKAEKSSRRMTPYEQLALRARFPRLDTPNAAFRNLGNGRFVDASDLWRFNERAVSQGMALGDLDGDGDLDVVINNFNGPATLLRNEATAPRIAVRLHGAGANTAGIGARITVTAGPLLQTQEIIAGGRYQSSDDPMRVFAVPDGATSPARIDVLWRSGRHTTLTNAVAGSLYVFEEAYAAPVQSEAPPQIAQPLFQDVSASLAYSGTHEPSDDLERQPLLPRRIFETGTAASWCDVNQDGWDDIVLAISGGSPLTYIQRNGHFLLSTNPGTIPQERRGIPWFYNALGSVLPPQPWAPGAFAMADVDRDGALDLFVGGRAIPGRYPEPVSCVVLLQKGTNFVVDPAATAVLTNVGLITSAVFSDIIGDTAPDLILASDWGSLRVFENRFGKLVEATASLGFNQFRGWWNSVASGDFNGDGRMDLIAGNWGQNSRFEAMRTQPLRLYYGDFDDNGVTEIIESYHDAAIGSYVPARQLEVMLKGMPSLQARFRTWDAFSRATVGEILGESAPAAKVLEANWLEHTVFLNRGNRFEAVPLPAEAQLAPVFGIAVADFDGDGHQDAFLAQNFFGTPPDNSRYDAGRGLMLRGDGTGHLRPMTGEESGIAIYGEGRAAAVADYDGDGRTDLLVTQHSGPAKLWRNQRAKPGVRVRLTGPSANRECIGAIVRIGDGKRWSAAREIHCGSGHGSQDAAVPVLARTGDQLQVRWPRGESTVTSIPTGAAEITVAHPGARPVALNTP